MVSFEGIGAEDRLAEAQQLSTPTATFDRAWAMACLESATAILKMEYDTPQRVTLFQALRPFLDPAMEEDHAQAALATGLNAGALRQAIFRLRRRFRSVLRQVVAQTLQNPTEALIDDELCALRAALSE
jgi:RNA polymerase sigma-70 factor (ECF subfamily)